MSIRIPFNDQIINGLLEEASNPKCLLILAHGAGAGMHHAFMNDLSRELVQNGISTLRFNFPYMEAGRKSPGSPKFNIAAWDTVLTHVLREYDLPVFISGKSYGGRMASHLLAQEPSKEVKGIVYFGFPLHAPGKDSKDRATHLVDVQVPQLFIQGTRDALANLALINEVNSELDQSDIKIIEGGDHSFKVKGTDQKSIIQMLATHTANWVDSVLN